MPSREITEHLTLQAAADELGVHYMTAYRYVRIGSLRATKTGKNWQVLVEDLRSFQNQALQNQVGLAASDPGVWVERFKSRAVLGDETALWEVISAALDTKLSPADVYLKVIGPALCQIGEEWSSGKLDVAQEHRAAKATERVIGHMSPRFRSRGVKRGTIVLGSVAGDEHQLGGTMVADLLRSEGFFVDDLGSNVPTESFLYACAEADRLSGVAIASYVSGNPAAIISVIAAIRQITDVPIILGGPGVADATYATSLGASAFAPSAIEAIAAFS